MHCITLSSVSRATETYSAAKRFFALKILNVRTKPNKRYQIRLQVTEHYSNTSWNLP